MILQVIEVSSDFDAVHINHPMAEATKRTSSVSERAFFVAHASGALPLLVGGGEMRRLYSGKPDASPTLNNPVSSASAYMLSPEVSSDGCSRCYVANYLMHASS